MAEYLAAKAPPRERMSFEEFLAWCDDTTWAEWVDGEVIILSPASLRHQMIKKLLVTVMDVFVQEYRLGLVVDAPFLVRLPERLRRGREPDIIFVRAEKQHLFREPYFDGAPDLVVEIVSPESAARDRQEKFHEYEAAGVGEYWLLDPDRQEACFYHLDAGGRYREIAVENGIYRSQAIPGFWLKVRWLWQDPLPAALEVLREIGVLSK
ncbi:MAG: Uma2 family endonuclease [Clostridia bacterium]|nr:MAG: Uma2 family endonuclease [Clostridia bacterium]